MEKLDITRIELPELKATLFKLTGAVDVFSYKDLKNAIDQWAKDAFKPALLIDMSGISYVGSSGWSVIFLQTVFQEKEAGHLILFGMSERVERSLNIIMPRKRHVNVSPDFEAAKIALEELRKASQTAQA